MATTKRLNIGASSRVGVSLLSWLPLVWFGLALGGLGCLEGMASDIERKPIEYSQSQGDNPISRLMAKVASGEVQLVYRPGQGYLQSLLEALAVPVESQTLVFSKTSLQRSRISPKTPRAIYFNDDVYVGFCRNGEVLEISVADPKLGTEFYTLSQQERERPQFVRQTEDCLICHGSSATSGIPGHLIRSVYTDYSGSPVLSMGSHRIDQTSPWKKRFGGWYVAGKYGKHPHLGNLLIRGDVSVEEVDNSSGLDVTELEKYFDPSHYLSSKSDVVAHLVLTHQAQVHNLLAKLSIETQTALYDELELNRELKEDPNKRWESTSRRIRSHSQDLVKALLFADEAELPEKIEGATDFANQFSSQAKLDSQGRSLRQLQLSKRLMQYPCSYLIYSDSFSALPKEAKQEVFRQMKSVLSGENQEKAFRNLTTEDRQAIHEILVDTLPDWTP